MSIDNEKSTSHNPVAVVIALELTNQPLNFEIMAKFENPWGKGGKYYQKNALHGSVLDKATSSPEESEIFCQSGTITFKNLTTTELSQFRVIPEDGTELITPDSNKSYQGDGFYYEDWSPERYWYKVSGGSSVLVFSRDDKLFIQKDESGTCRALAEALGKYYKVGWEPKTKKHHTRNPFDE